MEEINIYCDESCHLLGAEDNKNYMALGAITCNKIDKNRIFKMIKNLKQKHKFKPKELKWVKLHPNYVDLYKELIDFFFDEPSLSFRSILVDKKRLEHSKFHQSHDDFHYKIYYRLIEFLIEKNKLYNIFVDKKDDISSEKVKRTALYLKRAFNINYDIDNREFINVRNVLSHEIEILQLVDLLIGAITYNARRYKQPSTFKNKTKNCIADYLLDKTKYSLH